MSDNNVYLVANVGKIPSKYTGRVYEYITAYTDKDEALPVAFGKEEADALAATLGGEVVEMPKTLTSVHLGPGARKLPRTEATLRLEQVTEISM